MNVLSLTFFSLVVFEPFRRTLIITSVTLVIMVPAASSLVNTVCMFRATAISGSSCVKVPMSRGLVAARLRVSVGVSLESCGQNQTGAPLSRPLFEPLFRASGLLTPVWKADSFELLAWIVLWHRQWTGDRCTLRSLVLVAAGYWQVVESTS